MAPRDRHELDCLHLIQKPMWEVHAWLDELNRVFPYQLFEDYHRSFRHNSWGIQQCLEMWGPDGESAARIHLLRDWFPDVKIKWMGLAEALRQSAEAWEKKLAEGKSMMDCAREDGLLDRGLSKWQIKRAAEKKPFSHI